MGSGSGGNSNGFMAASSFASAAGSIAGSYAQSQALESQGVFAKQQYDFNSKIADLQAEDVLKRGDIAASMARSKGKLTLGAERTAIAAGNISVDNGTARDIQVQTKEFNAHDIMTIKNNAMQEAWGFKSQSLGYSGQGQFAEMASKYAATNTLLAGGMNAAAAGIKGAGYLNSYFAGPGTSPTIDTHGSGTYNTPKYNLGANTYLGNYGRGY